MSIQQEEILIKEFTSGTTITYFSTHLPFNKKLQNVTSAPPELIPTIVHLNNLNQILFLSTFDGKEVWTLNGDNVYTQQSPNTYITGYSFSVEQSVIISPNQINTIRSSFEDSMNLVYNTLSMTSVTESGLAFSGIQLTKVDYVLAENSEIEDFYVNVKLNRTTATLDTFNVYNNLINSMPTQDSETGVVFGRLMALQTIKDSEGNNIRIPLRNVPVGVFNPSETYPTAASVTENGDRIFLNIKESINQGEYFNIESFNFDKDKLLRSGSQFASVPEQYKYITKTNDEGEFVLYDIPIGNQVVVFEVDLLKQGLTRDEISLNFFPFPPDEDAIIDQIPNFSFKQFPINVVPAWGTIQTGYTELDVVVNMDLRKWTTYFFPPVSLYGQRLEQSVANNAGNTLKIKVRNMAKQGYPSTDIKLTEIPNDLDRVFNQQLNWQLEFAQIKNKADYYTFGCPIIKLPANLYDPFAYKTDSNGVPTNHKGVWLSAYQLKIFTDEKSNGTRTTGGIYAQGSQGTYFKSHFNLNYSSSVPDSSPHPSLKAGLGSFPYEKPWTIDYPNRYSIPAKPTDERYRYGGQRTMTSSSGIYYLDEPAYNDGDLIGYEVNGTDSNDGGGFGSQSAFGVWFHNRIAESITQSFMYKYESGVAWNEKYANGYEPSNPGYVRFAGASSVKGGEKYQRFESGYGYFLKPMGWPRVMRTTWGADTYFRPDIDSSGISYTPPIVADNLWSSYGYTNDVYNLSDINLALAMDNVSAYKEGTLEAYRVVNSNPENLAEPENFILPTWVSLQNGASASRAYYMYIVNSGTIPSTFSNTFGGIAFKNGSIPIGQYSNVTLGVGEYLLGIRDVPFPSSTRLGWTSFMLPGNDNYSPVTNRYEVARYYVFVSYNGSTEYGSLNATPFFVTAKLSPDTYYLKTNHSGGNNGKISYGLNTDYGGNFSAKIWGVRIEPHSSSYDL